MRYTLVLLSFLVAFVAVTSADQPEPKRCTAAQCNTFCSKSGMGSGQLEGSSMCVCSKFGQCNKQACLDFCKACNEGFKQASCPNNWCQCM